MSYDALLENAKRQTDALESIARSLLVIADAQSAPKPEEPKIDYNHSATDLSGLIGPLGKLFTDAVAKQAKASTFGRR